jgi:uncharacterized protein YqcC (DUF446 family)
MNHPDNKVPIYQLAAAKAIEIETALKKLNRWDSEPLPPEKFNDIGAFGSHTMAFEQWLQFILIPRIQEIVRTQGAFPTGSMIGSYAAREFGPDTESQDLQQLLYELDSLINAEEKPEPNNAENGLSSVPPNNTITMGDATIPPVLFQLTDALPQFEGSDLESQLQTFDTFLDVLSPKVRPLISNLLVKAASISANSLTKKRLEQAAASVSCGRRAAKPYDHNQAMEDYRNGLK